MKIVCLDLEGVLVPEIWIAISEAAGIAGLRVTTREEPDYDKLMKMRLELLKKNNLKLPDLQKITGTIELLPGALEFTKKLREQTQLVILSDTYEEFAKPLMEKLGWPTLFCNSFETDKDGVITAYKLRQKHGKKKAVEAFQSMGLKVFAAGDSYNDLEMVQSADSCCLFRAPEKIRVSFPKIPAAESYDGLLGKIESFLKYSLSGFSST